MGNVNRVMFAGTKSGSGKTTITCGILQCLMDMGYQVASFKCGPDFIDPMFHSKVIGTTAGNLDSFFTDEEVMKYLLINHSKGMDISVLEGVMGYYDGIGFSELKSSYTIASVTGTPVILILDTQGMGHSLGAVLKGFLEYKKDSHIKGVIFNRLPERLYGEAKKLAEGFGITPLGFVPVMNEVMLKSRHLGLVTADEILDIKCKIRQLAQKLKATLDLEGIVMLSGLTSELTSTYPQKDNLRKEDQQKDNPRKENLHKVNVPKESLQAEKEDKKAVRIAVAKDEAFCFLYKENLELLQELGAEITYFSPIKDKELPKGCSGLLLCGGYPEIYAEVLSKNTAMLASIKNAMEDRMPVIAECGGFMYLHESLEDMKGREYPMAGILEGKCHKTDRLQRFGYIHLKALKDNLLAKKGEEIKAHEFHYWDSGNCGTGFHARKASGIGEWDCIHISDTMYAGYPHLYFYSNPVMAERFVAKCLEYERKGIRND